MSLSSGILLLALASSGNEEVTDSLSHWPPHLQPCTAIAEASTLGLELTVREQKQLRSAAGSDASLGSVVAQLYLTPGDEEQGELWVGLYVPEQGDATVEVRTARSNIWKANWEFREGNQVPLVNEVLVPIHVERVSIPRQLAEKISRMLESFLDHVAYPLEEVFTTHAASWEFIGSPRTLSGGRYGKRCGAATTPSDSSQVEPLVSVWDSLLQLPSVPPENRMKSLASLEMKIDEHFGGGSEV